MKKEQDIFTKPTSELATNNLADHVWNYDMVGDANLKVEYIQVFGTGSKIIKTGSDSSANDHWEWVKHPSTQNSLPFNK